MTFKEIKNNADIRQKFLKEYSRLSGVEVCSTCTSKLLGYFQHYEKLLKMNNERKYELRPGSRVWVRAFNDYVTNDNLTDDKARKMIALSPAYKKCFIRMPEESHEKEITSTFDDVLLSVDGIGKGFLKKIRSLHNDSESLLFAIENGESTGIDESFNDAIKSALKA